LFCDNIKGEKKEETAVREVEEETGVVAQLGKPLSPITYWYLLDGEKRKKTVYYYLMEYISEDVSKKDDEMEQVEWLPMNEVEKKLTYESDKTVWKEAKELIAYNK
jgi:8-oxo-dGTP pyrophosphatase MutT (NUDIX family)